MNTALTRRLTKLEARISADITIRVQRGEVPFPDVEVKFVTAEPSYPQASYPQKTGYQPVDKSEKPLTIIDLEPGEDLNSVARELGITADELHRQRRSGLVRINFPMPEIPVSQLPKRGPVQVCWPINL